jgi:Na+/H+-translocating membrane pyrophosphatase
MTIRPPCARGQQGEMTLNGLLVLIVCLVVALTFSLFLTASHNRILGVMGFPLGFCSAIYVISMVGEISVRLGYSRMGRTPSALIQRSLALGTIIGAVFGVVFYFLGLVGTIPVVAQSAHRLLLSACLFGLSIDFTFAFIWMLKQGSRPKSPEKTK